MRILFVHQNFPAQFVHMAPALAARGHEVSALTVATNRRPSSVPRHLYAYEPPKLARSPITIGFDACAERGAIVARAAEKLRVDKGLAPDIVFGHVGWGESLFLKEVWPDARLLAYAEFYWRSRGLHFDFDPDVYPRDFESSLSAATATAAISSLLCQADRIVSPTAWQARSFPDAFQDRITVIHDGIDTAHARPDPKATIALPKRGLTFRVGDEVLTFVNRTLEPHRGYHTFMRALPRVLAARPKAHVVIVGGTGRESTGYGPPPNGGKSWRDIFLAEVADRLDMTRVHFVGKVPHDVFINLMQVSRAHAYLTYPGVLSWSMLEAMSCGAVIVGSRTPPVQEVITDGHDGRLVDFFDAEGLAGTLIDTLARPSAFQAMRANARNTIRERYDLATVCLPRQMAFVEGALTA
jgi:glycosyltransferase involved in cell wall biosynthesis